MKKIIKGQSLIEIIAAIGILSIVLTSVTIAVITALVNSESGKSGSAAGKTAQEGMELVRQIRDNDIAGFRKYEGTFCLDEGQTSLGVPIVDCVSPNVDHFIRSVKITQNGCGINIAGAEVVVLWTDGACENGTFCHKSQLNSCLATQPAASPTPVSLP